MRTVAIFAGSLLVLCGCTKPVTAQSSRAELEKLLNNPASDWSVIFPDLNKWTLNHGTTADEQKQLSAKQSAQSREMLELADLNGREYLKSHPTEVTLFTGMNVGHAQASKHNLAGTAEEAYCQKLTTVLVLLAMERKLTGTSDVVTRLKDAPKADFSQGKDEAILFFAHVDAIIYLENHKELRADNFNPNDNDVGPEHAANHHLLGDAADAYTVFFSSALDTLLKKE